MASPNREGKAFKRLRRKVLDPKIALAIYCSWVAEEGSVFQLFTNLSHPS